MRYRDLDIWKKGIGLVKDVYKITETYPAIEIYGLSSQLRRAAISIPSNIAEGFRRNNNKEFRRFLLIALGSCAELETQSTISRELEYITQAQEGIFLEELDHVSRMILNLIKKL